VLIHDVNRKYHRERVMERFKEAEGEACRALRRLRDEGTIRAFGCALNEFHVSLRSVREADVECIMLPQRFTLLDRSAETGLLPQGLERGRGRARYGAVRFRDSRHGRRARRQARRRLLSIISRASSRVDPQP
jgi:aryl-alcohol dehydrogenase-like predicted oxidoreductase